jgi:hypothetical protein
MPLPERPQPGRSPESVLSDFNGLRRHSRVLPTPRPLEPSGSGLRRRRTSPPRFWRRSRLFKGLGAKTCHKNRSRRLTLKSRSRVPYGKRELWLSEKQYHISAGLARNCRFFLTSRRRPRSGVSPPLWNDRPPRRRRNFACRFSQRPNPRSRPDERRLSTAPSSLNRGPLSR